jgi:hypothetical protein
VGLLFIAGCGLFLHGHFIPSLVIIFSRLFAIRAAHPYNEQASNVRTRAFFVCGKLGVRPFHGLNEPPTLI